MDIRIQAVLISSLVAVSLFFIRDFLLPKWKTNKEEKKQKIEVYKKYAEPLGKSAESMFWRLDEIFFDSTKAKFLERGKVITDFDNYKYISTLYRLGSLLGWIAAIKKSSLTLEQVIMVIARSCLKPLKISRYLWLMDRILKKCELNACLIFGKLKYLKKA